MEDLWIGVEVQQRGRSDNSGASSAKKSVPRRNLLQTSPSRVSTDDGGSPAGLCKTRGAAFLL